MNGWKNYIFDDDDVFQLALGRAEDCAKCIYARNKAYQILTEKKELKDIEGMVCSKCSCPLSTKLRSKTETCPLNKW